MSTANRSTRKIHLISERGHKEIFRGKHPGDQTSHVANADMTMRLGVFEGDLYFSENNGLSLYTEKGTKEMIEKYKREEKWFSAIVPLSNFSFGKNYMVAITPLEGSAIPLLCVFKPEYTQSAEDMKVAKDNQIIQPESFSLAYCGHVPRTTGTSLWSSSISAYDNQFAMTHHVFNKVFVYKMQDIK